MSKFLYAVITCVVIVIASPTHSQTTDSVKIAVKDAIRVLAAADSAKAHLERIELLKRDTATLGQRTRELTESRNAYKKADSLGTELARLKDTEVATSRDKTKIATDMVTRLNTKLDKQRRRTRWVGISGTVTTIAGIIITLIIKK